MIHARGIVLHSPALSRSPFHVFLHSLSDFLHIDLNTPLITWATLGESREQVGDIVPRMSVQAGTQSLLIQEVGNQTDTTSEYEETVENAHLEVVLGFFGRESTTVAEEINKADSNTAVDVEDQVVLLAGGDSLNRDGVV